MLLTDNFAATGTVRLISGNFKSSVQCKNASFRRSGGVALALDGATIATWLSLKSVTFDGGVRLYRTSADGLEDDLGYCGDELGSWSSADPLVLTAFSVKRFEGAGDPASREKARDPASREKAWDPALREKWLRKSDHFDPGTWESLIVVYRDHGRESDARDAAIARENDRLRRAAFPGHERSAAGHCAASSAMAIGPCGPGSGHS